LGKTLIRHLTLLEAAFRQWFSFGRDGRNEPKCSKAKLLKNMKKNFLISAMFCALACGANGQIYLYDDFNDSTIKQ
jgi:hypothetical protein